MCECVEPTERGVCVEWTEWAEETEKEGFREVGVSLLSFTESTTREANSEPARDRGSSSDETSAVSSLRYSFSSAGRNVERVAPLFHFYSSWRFIGFT